MNALNHFENTEMLYSTIPIGYIALLRVCTVLSTALNSSHRQLERSSELLTQAPKT